MQNFIIQIKINLFDVSFYTIKKQKILCKQTLFKMNSFPKFAYSKWTPHNDVGAREYHIPFIKLNIKSAADCLKAPTSLKSFHKKQDMKNIHKTFNEMTSVVWRRRPAAGALLTTEQSVR